LGNDLFQIRGLRAGYGDAEILHGIDLEVRKGEFVAVLGANGAGKTTLINTILGTTKIMSGTISLDGKRLEGSNPDSLVKMGLAFFLQGRRVFPQLTVEENLRMGGYTLDGETLTTRISEIEGLFPFLKERSATLAGNLSGGEQVILAFARARMTSPQLFFVDEPSLGVAPIITKSILGNLKDETSKGGSVLLAEQNVLRALEVSDRVYIMNLGRIVYSGTPEELRQTSNLSELYLGMNLKNPEQR
jgi:branched-chain amino acid transport system ATP-binding protein